MISHIKIKRFTFLDDTMRAIGQLLGRPSYFGLISAFTSATGVTATFNITGSASQLGAILTTAHATARSSSRASRAHTALDA